MKTNIKLIIVDFYGVIAKGSYKDTCRWLAKKYKIDYDNLYKVIYHKYFIDAVRGKISERDSFVLAIKELKLKENWKDLRKRHLSFIKLNKPAFDFCRNIQKNGYVILLLSQNTPRQFTDKLKEFHVRRYFNNIVNTFDYKLPKADKKVIQKVLKTFKVKPSEAIMIDDQDFNLIEARKMGVKTVFYHNFRKFRGDMEKFVK